MRVRYASTYHPLESFPLYISVVLSVQFGWTNSMNVAVGTFPNASEPHNESRQQSCHHPRGQDTSDGKHQESTGKCNAYENFSKSVARREYICKSSSQHLHRYRNYSHKQDGAQQLDECDTLAIPEQQVSAGSINKNSSSNYLRRFPFKSTQRSHHLNDSTARYSVWRNSKPGNVKLNKGSSGQAPSPIRCEHASDVCRFYKKSGECRYGDKCRYRHTDVEENPEHPNVECAGQSRHEPNSSDSYTRYFIRNKHISYSCPSMIERNNPPQRSTQFNQKRRFLQCGSSCKSRGTEQDINNLGAAEEVQRTVSDVKSSSFISTKTVEDEIGQLSVSKWNESDGHIQHSRQNKQIVLPSAMQGYLLENLTDDDLEKLRQTEISQLLRRFVDAQDIGDGKTYGFEFKASDPDWPYEVGSLALEIVFPKLYPKECFEVKPLDTQERLPTLLVRHLNKQMRQWTDEKQAGIVKTGRCQLLFRPFLRWLDRNLEALFTNGLRAAKKELEAKALGIEFVIPEDLPASQAKLEDNESNGGNTDTEKDILVNLNVGKHVHFEDSVHVDLTESNNSENTSETTQSNHLEFVTVTSSTSTDKDMAVKDKPNNTSSMLLKKGTEIKFRSLFLGESVASLSCQKLFLSIQCSRCRTRRDILLTAKTTYNVKCEKCHLAHMIIFRPDLLHEFSAVVGYLDLSDCQAVDIPLMNCVFQITCLTCDKRGQIDGIHYGQQHSAWCQHCNAKMTIYIESVKFHKLQNSHISGKNLLGQTITIQSCTKKTKDPVIHEGKPLPDCGTCQHYKKSFRWLRFPCCGKTYPCDRCHDEKETDHEMKYATRMICGFCAKEQPYSLNNPCIACNSNMTKKASSHWEGGKGCRDKLKMARDDDRKYSGRSKTVSRKAAVTSNSKKKSGQKTK